MVLWWMPLLSSPCNHYSCVGVLQALLPFVIVAQLGLSFYITFPSLVPLEHTTTPLYD